MAASSFPSARRQPHFVASQPFDGPRNDAIRDEMLWGPLLGFRGGVVQAQRRLLKSFTVPVHMLRPGGGRGVPHHERRIEQSDNGLVGVFDFQFLDPEATNVADLDGVGPTDRAQLASPNRRPVARPYPEIRVEHVHPVDLGRDRQAPSHFGGSEPKKVCEGAAKDLVGADTAMAGAARPERTMSMRPDPRS